MQNKTPHTGSKSQQADSTQSPKVDPTHIQRRRTTLPFQRNPRDAGEWSYDHRAGIAMTLIAYLIIGIVFVGGKVKLNANSMQGAILVDFPEDRTVEFTPEQLEQLRLLEQYGYDDFSDVSNVASNQNVDFGEAKGRLNTGLSDDRSTDASELYDDAGELDGQMAANRAEYEAGLARSRAMAESHNKGRDEQSQTSQASEDVKVKGRVTVSFSFINPIRRSQNLVVPAYMCEGGGEVTVVATLDTNGYVTSASIDKGSSSGDYCMQETALKAARGSRFNLDTSAPTRHQGTITYMFIPQ